LEDSGRRELHGFCSIFSSFLEKAKKRLAFGMTERRLTFC
jgi:hypothetical protein